MKLLADENFPSRLISSLQKQGHKVTRTSRSIQGVTDSGILTKALTEKRIIFTFDKGFTTNQREEVLVNVVVFNFPTTRSHQLILSLLDHLLTFIQARKKKKKPFILVCSENEIIEVSNKD